MLRAPSSQRCTDCRIWRRQLPGYRAGRLAHLFEETSIPHSLVVGSQRTLSMLNYLPTKMRQSNFSANLCAPGNPTNPGALPRLPLTKSEAGEVDARLSPNVFEGRLASVNFGGNFVILVGERHPGDPARDFHLGRQHRSRERH